jgi:hypothetical protein
MEGLVYVRTGLFPEETPKVFSSARGIPDFGLSVVGGASREPAYLIANAHSSIHVRPVPQLHGGMLYAVDQSVNPHTVVLRPGGLYAEHCVISGQLGTISETSESTEIYNRIAASIRRAFQKVRSYWLGPEAEKLWRSGFRLTVGVNSPQALDLK